MAFSLKTRRVRGIVLVDLSGRLSAGDAVSLLHNTIGRLAGQKNRKFVLNLEGVSYIDSYGIGELLATYTTLSNKGYSMCLLNPTERTTHLLKITKLLPVFDVFDDEDRAIEAQAGITAVGS